MSRTRFHSAFLALFLMATLTASSAQTLQSLYGFIQTNSDPYGGVVQAPDGNLWGTTTYGGANNSGSVFKITPGGNLTTVYSFCAQTSCADGSYPMDSLVVGTNGNLYGITNIGGNTNNGTIYEITTAGKFTSLHSFSGPDGQNPRTALILASNGNFYGVAYSGGANSTGGTIFEMTRPGSLPCYTVSAL